MHDNDLLGGAVLLANLTYHSLFAGQGLLLQTMWNREFPTTWYCSSVIWV